MQTDKGTEMASVNLLIRVKCSRKKSSKRNRDTKTLLSEKDIQEEKEKENETKRKRSLKSLLNTSENKKSQDSEIKLKRKLKTEKRKSERSKQRKVKKKLKKKKYVIGLVVSNVTSDGKPGKTLATINSTLKKTKTFNVALPIDKINHSLRTNTTLQLYVQCFGCGRKASLILIHKSRKRKRAHDKRKDMFRFLHKRRPRLLIESHITQSMTKS